MKLFCVLAGSHVISRIMYRTMVIIGKSRQDKLVLYMIPYVRHILHARSLAFKSGNETGYKVAMYQLEKAITEVKRPYREKLDSFYSTADYRRMWQGLQHITDFRESLPDDLNTFYTRFEISSHTTERDRPHPLHPVHP